VAALAAAAAALCQKDAMLRLLRHGAGRLDGGLFIPDDTP